MTGLLRSVVHVGLLLYLMTAQMLHVPVLFVLRMVLSRKQYAKIAWGSQGLFLHLFVWLYERHPNLKVYVSGDEVPHDESALVVANHVNQDYFPLYSMAARQLKGFMGGIKVIVKQSLLYIPFFGLTMWLCDFIFLKRDWNSDKDYLRDQLDILGNTGLPMQIILFPEGTRLHAKNHAASCEFARKSGQPEPKHVLIPRTKGLVAVVHSVRGGSIKHIYDVTLAYTGWKQTCKYKGPDMLPVFFPPRPDQEVAMHVHYKRYKVEDLPTSDADLDKWCKQVFRDKDALLEKFNSSDKKGFPGAKEIPFEGTNYALTALALYTAVMALCLSLMWR